MKRPTPTAPTIRLAALTLVALPLAASSVFAAEAPVEPELLFRASFDRLTAFADFARGDPASTLETSLELRALPGVPDP